MRKNAVVVDKDGNIKHTVASMRMVYDLVEVTYVSGQSINNGCFSSVSVFARNSGDDRVFFLINSGRSVRLEQLITPSTYDDMEKMRVTVREFNS